MCNFAEIIAERNRGEQRARLRNRRFTAVVHYRGEPEPYSREFNSYRDAVSYCNIPGSKRADTAVIIDNHTDKTVVRVWNQHFPKQVKV